ncbi:hypothetical protein PJP07_31420, partial [Mycobacterium kansasii]
FKDPAQWPDLINVLDVLDGAAKVVKVDVSPIRTALLRFHDSINALSSAEALTVPPEVLEYKEQLAHSKERVSQLAP